MNAKISRYKINKTTKNRYCSITENELEDFNQGRSSNTQENNRMFVNQLSKHYLKKKMSNKYEKQND